MDRRAFLGTLAGGLLAAPLAAEAQQAGKIPRIGLLQPGPRPSAWAEAFREGLRDHGYVEGKNLIVEFRAARDVKEQPALIAELIGSKVDVLVTWSTPAALAARRATSTIPIVVVTGDPTRTGLAASLARPGGNMTGIAVIDDELEVKRLQVLREAVPTASRVAVMWNPDNPVWVGTLQRLRGAAPRLGIKLHELPVTDPSRLEEALRSAIAAGVGALLVVNEGLLLDNRKILSDLVTKHRLPAMYPQPEFIALGGLMSYSANQPDMLRRLAAHVDKILRGAKPADLPIEQPTKFELVINLRTAKALGLTIPPSLLQRADQVIE
jgi:putative ABC transport system substrate-binding protein